MANRKYYNLSNENIENRINEIKEWLDNTKLNKIKKELNELNNTIITKYRTGFQLSEEEKNEFDKITSRINILNEELKKENELNNTSIDDLKNELNKLENPINVIDSLSFGDETNKKQYNDRNIRIKEIKKLIKEKEEQNNKELEFKELNNEINERNNSLYIEKDNINSYINDLNAKINQTKKAIIAKNNKLYSFSTEELEEKIENIKFELSNTKLNNLIKELNKLENTAITEFHVGFQLNDNEQKEYNALLEKINNLKEEIKLEEKYEDELKNKSIEELKKELKILDNPLNVLSSLNFGEKKQKEDYNNNKIKINKINKLIEEKEKREILNEQLLELTNELNYRNNLLNSEEKNKLNNLSNIRNSYNNIINDTVNAYNNNEIDNIEDFVNNHKDIDIINNYENAEKLKNELIDEIKNKLKIDNKKDNDNKITKKENNKKLWMKSLGCAAGGLALGLGASTIIPNLGVIIIGTKLASAGIKKAYKEINIQAKNNPQGKCASIIKIIQNQKDKHQNIIKNINEMRAKLKEKPYKYLINGFYAGVAIGNIIEATTGQDIGEHISDMFKNNSNGGPQITPGNVTAGNIPEPQINPSNVTSELLSTNISDLAGQSYDLSSVPQGFASSYSNEPVSLLTESAKNLSFDKANFVNGEEWWHFLKPDGEGYAWFKADDIRHLVEGTLKSGKSI